MVMVTTTTTSSILLLRRYYPFRLSLLLLLSHRLDGVTAFVSASHRPRQRWNFVPPPPFVALPHARRRLGAIPNHDDQDKWKVISNMVTLENPWLRLVGERLQDLEGKQVEYWRVEKADSVIVLTFQQDRFVLPKPMYRPGIGQCTLDFPGGRLGEEDPPLKAARRILQREIGVTDLDLVSLQAMNTNGWLVNSSFSNQKLWAFCAELRPEWQGQDVVYYSMEDVSELLHDLVCLQCRSILLEFLLTRKKESASEPGI